ncbi:MAG: T9SS type A sorting domain-containing protein [Candidatus Kapaibacterium sp.]
MKRIAILILVAFTVPCSAQWKNDGGASDVLAFGIHDTNIFVSSNTQYYPWHLVYRFSPNSPGDWFEADNGIDGTQGLVTSFASLGDYFFAGMTLNGGPGAAYRSTDNGSNWALNAGGYVCTNGIDMFAVGADGIYRSADSGNTGSWQKVSSFIATDIAAMGTYIFASRFSGVIRSTNSGLNWSAISPPFIGTMTVMDSILFIVGNGELLKSTDSGSNWSMVTVDSAGVPWYVNMLVTDGKSLFAGTPHGVLVSTDTGHSWQVRNEGFSVNPPNTALAIRAMIVYDTLLFVTTATNPLYTYLYSRPISELTAKSGVVDRMVPVDSIEVYPNPTLDRVSILSGGTSILGVRVLNVLGTDVLDLPKVNGPGLTFDLSKLPSGTYFLEIETAKGMVLRKVIRE